MPREIKFRAWEPTWKMMFYSDHGDIMRCGTGFEWYPVAIPCDNGKEPPDDNPGNMELMQYIGIKDKNGKEIYEGDITTEGVVEYRTDLNWDGGGSVHPGFYFHVGIEGDLDYHRGFDDPDLEVIGNIHENPELLK